MKYFYLTIILFISLNSLGQSDISGEWFLHYLEIDGEQQYSTIPNSFNNIIFSDDNTFNGTVCSNGYTGNYTEIDDDTILITNLSAFAGTCNYIYESELFLNPYFYTVLDDLDAQNDEFNYTILGSGDAETLTLTNSENNRAFYGRSPLAESDILGTWFLNSITKNDVTEVNVYEPNFYINFTLNHESYAGLAYNGFAICEAYSGAYSLKGTDAIKLTGISFTLTICQQYGRMFEESYLSFFAEAQTVPTMFLDFSVNGLGDDETLILTSENGDYLTYGRQPVSVPDNQLISRWYLQYINVDGEQFDNYYNTPSENLDFDLTNVVDGPSENILRFDGSSSCNGFGGGYSYTESTLTFENMAVTLLDCGGTPSGIYETYYLFNILRSDENLPNTLNYNLSGSGINETLTLTESSGDFAVYGRIPTTARFFTEWYLSSIESNGAITEILDTDSPSINLTTERYHPILPGLTFNGQGDCNAFNGDYSMYFNGTNSIKINSFNSESASCSSDYETDYFSILSDPSTNEFSYELLNANATLILTDLAGNKVIYSGQPLSIAENTIENFEIRLKENPAYNELKLDINQSLGDRFNYRIFSIDGKQITEGKLSENFIVNIEKLMSGMYFLAVISDENQRQTLKFVKK